MLVVILVTCLLVLLSVGVHYNALILYSLTLQKRRVNLRRWVAASILGLLLAHVIEVSLFAIGYLLLVRFGDYGQLIGSTDELTQDYWYYSFVAYTSLGFGDIVPTHSLRLMTALETLTGLILIAWSASFLIMQMERFWDPEEDGISRRLR
ncbi:MAG: two pore domain potassium channel family protein [Planctomycetales bacterium]|nr:two pore domain potassium channel family protein [Planctomycetales bacterium]